LDFGFWVLDFGLQGMVVIENAHRHDRNPKSKTQKSKMGLAIQFQEIERERYETDHYPRTARGG
jgi:hypothetical protein